MAEKQIGLAQLIYDVKLTLQSSYELPIWVIAEISELNINRSGHCYLELIEKDSVSDKIIAKSRATIWSFAFRTLKPFFETTTGESFRAGLKVLLKVSIEFHEVFGFSLNVQDIDPQYTLGDLARKKAEIIKQLEEDGVFDMNKSLEIPSVPQRIAVISSETAAGYGDFKNQLETNSHNFKFTLELFSAIMQGNQAVESIIIALNQIYDRLNEFDIVVIIRGGGSKTDLHCFDDYDLAYNITQFPIPVLTGIGHERDETIADMVANTRLKTPTAVAEFVINQFLKFDNSLNNLALRLTDGAEFIIENAQHRLIELSHNFNHVVKSLLDNNLYRLEKNQLRLMSSSQSYLNHKMDELRRNTDKLKIISDSLLHHEYQFNELLNNRLSRWAKNYLKAKEVNLQMLESKVELVNPDNILKRGYAIVTKDNEVLNDTKNLKIGDKVVVKLHKGKFDSNITDVN